MKRVDWFAMLFFGSWLALIIMVAFYDEAQQKEMMNEGFDSEVLEVVKATESKHRYTYCHEEYEWIYVEQFEAECRWRVAQTYPPSWEQRDLDTCWTSLRRISDEAHLGWTKELLYE